MPMIIRSMACNPYYPRILGKIIRNTVENLFKIYITMDIFTFFFCFLLFLIHNRNNVNDFISLLVNILQYDFVSGHDPRFSQVEVSGQLL